MSGMKRQGDTPSSSGDSTPSTPTTTTTLASTTTTTDNSGGSTSSTPTTSSFNDSSTGTTSQTPTSQPTTSQTTTTQPTTSQTTSQTPPSQTTTTTPDSSSTSLTTTSLTNPNTSSTSDSTSALPTSSTSSPPISSDTSSSSLFSTSSSAQSSPTTVAQTTSTDTSSSNPRPSDQGQSISSSRTGIQEPVHSSSRVEHTFTVTETSIETTVATETSSYVTIQGGQPVTVTTVFQETLSSTVLTVELVTGTGTAPPSLNDINGSKSSSGFFSNTGAVVGVFVVVGLAAAAIVLGLLFFHFRRKRRREMDQDLRIAAGGAGAAGAGEGRLGEDDDDDEEFLGGAPIGNSNAPMMSQVHDSNLYRPVSRQDGFGHSHTISADSIYPIAGSAAFAMGGYQANQFDPNMNRESSMMDNSAHSDYGGVNAPRQSSSGHQSYFYDPNFISHPNQSSGMQGYYDPNIGGLAYGGGLGYDDNYSPHSSGENDEQDLFTEEKPLNGYETDHPMMMEEGNDSSGSLPDDRDPPRKILRVANPEH